MTDYFARLISSSGLEPDLSPAAMPGPVPSMTETAGPIEEVDIEIEANRYLDSGSRLRGSAALAADLKAEPAAAPPEARPMKSDEQSQPVVPEAAAVPPESARPTNSYEQSVVPEGVKIETTPVASKRQTALGGTIEETVALAAWHSPAASSQDTPAAEPPVNSEYVIQTVLDWVARGPSQPERTVPRSVVTTSDKEPKSAFLVGSKDQLSVEPFSLLEISEMAGKLPAIEDRPGSVVAIFPVPQPGQVPHTHSDPFRAPAAVSSPHTAQEEAVYVSIGSIRVQVEADTPTLPPLWEQGGVSRPSVPRSTNNTRLRRRYLRPY